MDSPYFMLGNVKSGKRSRERLEALREKLAECLGGPVDWLPVRGGKGLAEALDKVRSAGRGTLFVAGGDGTISAAADAIKDTDVALAPLPMGTFNFFARGLGIPETPEDAVRALCSGEVAHIPVGEVNGRVFLNNASVGLYPTILAARESIYNSWGRSRFAAYWSVLKTVMRGGHRMRFTFRSNGDEHDLVTPMFFVAANPFQLEHFRLEGADTIRADEHLVAFAGSDRGRFGLISTALRLATGRARRDAEFDLMDGREMELRTWRRRVSVAIDGERMRFQTPVRFRMRPGGLRVLAPKQADLRRAA